MRLLHNRLDNGIIYLGDLSFIKVFEVFGDFLFHLAGIMYILLPLTPKEEKRETTFFR